MATETNNSDCMKEACEAVDPLAAAAEYGIDLAQRRDNLALTVAERLRRHTIALDTVEALRKAARP